MDGDVARRLRMGGQLLDAGPRAHDPVAVAAGLVGVQAQDLTAASLSIRARTEGLVMGDIHRAATEPGRHTLALIWSLRGTRHLHAVGDVRWLLGLLGPAFGRPGARAEQLGIGGRIGEKAVEVLAEALATGATPTRGEVAELLAGHGVDPTTRAPIHIIRRAALSGFLGIIPGPGGDERRERYISLDAWLPPEPAGERGAPELVRRYLAAYGPARPADLAAWSGLGPRIVATAWQQVVDEMVEVKLANGGPAWRLDSVPEAPEPGPAPCRLLGGFDTLILGYADRTLHLEASLARAVNAGGGLIKPVVEVDGRVVATWKLRRHQVEGRPGATIELSSLSVGRSGSDLPSRAHRQLGQEVDDMSRFLHLPLSPQPVWL